MDEFYMHHHRPELFPTPVHLTLFLTADPLSENTTGWTCKILYDIVDSFVKVKEGGDQQELAIGDILLEKKTPWCEFQKFTSQWDLNSGCLVSHSYLNH
jgi:hypothetical protein